MAVRDFFQIGAAQFDFAADAAVVFEEGGMRFDLRAQPVPFDAALHQQAFDPEGFDNPQPGVVAPSFWTSTFFFYDNHASPQRTVKFPQQGPAPQWLHIWEKGFRYGTRFFGTIHASSGHIEMQGHVRRDYEDESQGVAVHVVRHFPAGDVVLKAYTYSSVEEALAMPAERVRRLLIDEWDGQWRDEILRFDQLEFLSLHHLFAKQGEPATVLPEALGDLIHLREFHLRSPSITRLPERLGDLAQLEVLSVSYGQLDALPASIAKLERLHRLVLDGNRLTTLPDSVGELPALTELRINGNPFESLPATLQKVRRVDVERKYEALFRDIRYRPDVEVTIDREQFMARASPKHAAALSDALARRKLESYEKALLRHARQALRLRTTEPEDYAAPGSTRIGGAPDLPPDLEYPMVDGRLCIFYAQIDLAAIAPLQTWLPRTGMLYVFAGGEEQGEDVRVLHVDAPVTQLNTYASPAEAEFVDGGALSDVYQGYKVRVNTTVSVPNLYGAENRLVGEDAVLLGIADDDRLQQAYWALEAEFTDEGDRRHGAHLMNAHVFTQHETPQEQASRAKGGLPEEWINLLMFASDAHPGFCFWDAGTLTLSIHEKDLALGDFSRIHASIESS